MVPGLYFEMNGSGAGVRGGTAHAASVAVDSNAASRVRARLRTVSNNEAENSIAEILISSPRRPRVQGLPCRVH
jgi:hypothetical protein